jgi:DNA-binding Lrp family transcriptional regulator
MKDIETKLIHFIQEELPMTENPYETLGEMLGIEEAKVVELLNKLKSEGKLKRISAILRHQKSGYTANAMVVFNVAESQVDALGRTLTASHLVSHCYERHMHEKWPYNLYAMVHGKTEGEVEAFIAKFVSDYGVQHYAVLSSVEELKKTSMKYL